MYPVDKAPRVATFKEIVVLVLFFGAVLGLLHSKDIFQKLLLSEKSNYDLTEAYLRNLVRLNPDNVSMLYEFAKVLIHQGKYDLAETMLSALENSKDEKIRQKALNLRYALLKRQLAISAKKREKEAIVKRMRKVLTRIVARHMSEEEMKKWLQESREIGADGIALTLLKKLVNEHPADFARLEEIYQKAVAEKNTEMVDWAMTKFYERRGAWLGDYAQAPLAYRKKAARLVSYLLKKRENRKAADVAVELYRHSHHPDDLEHALDYLVWGGHYDRAVALAKKYESALTRDKAGAKKVLDLYLAAGRTDEARRLSLKLLQKVKR